MVGFLHTPKKLWKAKKDRGRKGREEGREREKRGRREVPSRAGGSEPVPPEDQQQHPGRANTRKRQRYVALDLTPLAFPPDPAFAPLYTQPGPPRLPCSDRCCY